MEEMLNWASAAVLNVADAIFSPDEPEENMTGSSLIIPLALTGGLITAGLI